MAEITAVDTPHARHEFRAFKTRQEACIALADELESSLKEALSGAAGASLVVSGGSSPVALFHSLRTRKLDWKRVIVIPSDERVVAADHPGRNDAMIRRELLQDEAAAAQLLSLLPGQGDDFEITSQPIPNPLDAVVLGMGDDGHTASLFPDSPEIASALVSRKPLLRLAVPRLNMDRVSLGPAVLLSAGRIDLLFFGEDKRAVFKAAAEQGTAESYPIRVILHQGRVPVRVFWAP